MKLAKFHPAVRSLLREFPRDVSREIGKAILELQWGVKLPMPLSRPMPDVGPGVHEIRIKDRSGAYRVFYATVSELGVLVFHAFQKKTKKTPQKEIDLGRKRLRELKELIHEEV